MYGHGRSLWEKCNGWVTLAGEAGHVRTNEFDQYILMKYSHVFYYSNTCISPSRLCNRPRWEDNLHKRSEYILIGLHHTCIYYMLNLYIYIYIYIYSRKSLSKNPLIVTPILSLLSPITYWHGHMQNCSASRFFIHIAYVPIVIPWKRFFL